MQPATNTDCITINVYYILSSIIKSHDESDCYLNGLASRPTFFFTFAKVRSEMR